MTPEISQSILGVLVLVLGFIAAWQFKKIIDLGERLAKLDTEIINIRTQADKTEGTVASAITRLDNSLQNIGHNIETKVTALHQRFDRLLLDRQHGS